MKTLSELRDKLKSEVSNRIAQEGEARDQMIEKIRMNLSAQQAASAELQEIKNENLLGNLSSQLVGEQLNSARTRQKISYLKD